MVCAIPERCIYESVGYHLENFVLTDEEVDREQMCGSKGFATVHYRALANGP